MVNIYDKRVLGAIIASIVLIFIWQNYRETDIIDEIEDSPCNAGPHVSVVEQIGSLQKLYLDLLRDSLTGVAFKGTEHSVTPGIGPIANLTVGPLDVLKRNNGTDWPYTGYTMIGVKRMDNIRAGLAHVINTNIPGDYVECGVWRGGSAIFAAGVFSIMQIRDRKVWAVDSFEGYPLNRTTNDDDSWAKQAYANVSKEQVQANFESFELWNDRVKLVKGNFMDSLPTIEVKQVAVLRVNGNMYESTMDVLFNLYERVQMGGWVIVNDYTIPACKKAINEFRAWHQINETINEIDGSGVYWIKGTHVTVNKEHYTPLLPKQTNK